MNIDNKQEMIEKIANLSFEQALAELEKIVTMLEKGEGSLENAIDQYEYGNALRQYCEKKLKDAKLKIDKIVQNNDGSIAIVDLDKEQ
jgi:exodeoxyribonuclease VII small subunit